MYSQKQIYTIVFSPLPVVYCPLPITCRSAAMAASAVPYVGTYWDINKYIITTYMFSTYSQQMCVHHIYIIYIYIYTYIFTTFISQKEQPKTKLLISPPKKI